MLGPKARWRAMALAVAVGLCQLSWPAAALADGLNEPPGSLQETITTATDSLGDALGETSSPLPTVSDPIADATKTVVSTTVDTIATVAGVGGSPASSSTSSETGSESGSDVQRSTSTAKAAPSSPSARSSRAISAAGPAGAGSTRGFTTLYQSFAPPPPRYGGLNEGLAVTGTNVTLPLAVLAVLIVMAVGSQTAERVRNRYRMYGALRYRGRHRMPPRRRALRLAPAV